MKTRHTTVIPESIQEWINSVSNTPDPSTVGWPETALIRAVLRAKDSYQRVLAPRTEIHRRIADLRAQGLTIREITETLNQEGPPPSRAGRWHIQRVALILKQLNKPVQRAAEE